MTIWDKRTNKGRVVYHRKPHRWSDNDLTRITKAFAADNESEPAFMSDVADRMLFWLCSTLNPAGLALVASTVSLRLIDFVQGIAGYAAGRNVAKAATGWGTWPPFPSGVVQPVDERMQYLSQVKANCQVIVDYINGEQGYASQSGDGEEGEG